MLLVFLFSCFLNNVIFYDEGRDHLFIVIWLYRYISLKKEEKDYKGINVSYSIIYIVSNHSFFYTNDKLKIVPRLKQLKSFILVLRSFNH